MKKKSNFFSEKTCSVRNLHSIFARNSHKNQHKENEYCTNRQTVEIKLKTRKKAQNDEKSRF